MVPIIDLEKIDWDAITDTKSLFESILDTLKSREMEIKLLREENEASKTTREEIARMCKEIKLLREENAAFAGDHETLAAMSGMIEQLRAENAALVGRGGGGADIS